MKTLLALGLLLTVGGTDVVAKPTPAIKCAAAKRKATARKIAAKLGCQTQALLQGAAVDPLCLAKAESVFGKTFHKAESKGGCFTTGDASAVEATADDCVANVVSRLPAVGTTTTTRPPAVCANGIREGTEECDDGNIQTGDGCDATCHLEATPEVEPNDIPAEIQILGAAPKLVAGTLEGTTDFDWYRFTLATQASLRIEISDTGGPGSCATLQTHIFLFDGVGADVLGDTGGGVNGCSLLDPAVNPEVVGLPAGTYSLEVDSNGLAGGTYQLRILPR